MFSHPSLHHIYNDDDKELSLNKLLQGPDKNKWNNALSNKFGQLAKDKKDVPFTETIKFIMKKCFFC